MFNAFLCTFSKLSENKTFWIFVTRKEKSVFNFHILKAAYILNFCFASGIKKVSGHIEKRSEKKNQNEKCWTFQKLSDRKRSEFWAVAWKRSEFFRMFFRTRVKVQWTFTSKLCELGAQFIFPLWQSYLYRFPWSLISPSWTLSRSAALNCM